MFERTTNRISKTPYPRLTTAIFVGIGLLILGAILWLFEPAVAIEAGLTWYRVAIAGYLLVLFGVSGYVAITVFDRRPEP